MEDHLDWNNTNTDFFFSLRHRGDHLAFRNMQLVVHLQWGVLPDLGWAYPTKVN